MIVKDEDLVETLSEQVDGGGLDAAVYARVDTPLGFTRWLTPIGNYLIARPAARSAARKRGKQVGTPLDAAMVLGIGAGALQVWSADPMLNRVGKHLGSLPLERLTKIEARPAQSWWPLTILTKEGESIELQARGDVGGLTDAFERRA